MRVSCSALVPEVFLDFSSHEMRESEPQLVFAASQLWFSHLMRRKIKKNL